MRISFILKFKKSCSHSGNLTNSGQNDPVILSERYQQSEAELQVGLGSSGRVRA